jgi:hypothetical protein
MRLNEEIAPPGLEHAALQPWMRAGRTPTSAAAIIRSPEPRTLSGVSVNHRADARPDEMDANHPASCHGLWFFSRDL